VLAVDDAVAAANTLAAPLRRAQRDGTSPDEKHLADVQARREFPTVMTQRMQQAFYKRLVEPAFRREAPGSMPMALRAVRHVPAILRTIAVGVRQEHIRTSSAFDA
jgi:hypothetical protein